MFSSKDFFIKLSWSSPKFHLRVNLKISAKNPGDTYRNFSKDLFDNFYKVSFGRSFKDSSINSLKGIFSEIAYVFSQSILLKFYQIFVQRSTNFTNSFENFFKNFSEVSSRNSDYLFLEISHKHSLSVVYLRIYLE